MTEVQTAEEEGTLGVMNVAMADAVLAIEGDYKPFRVQSWAPRGASAEAAAAQAGHDDRLT